MCIVISGDPNGGFVYWGPFDDQESAIAFAEEEITAASWWVVELLNPEASCSDARDMAVSDV